MDTISTLINNINLQNQQTTTTQPSPQLTTSINQLRSFSTALSAFINHYDELHTHINFINSSIDSILPPHLLQTVVNPNLLITSSDRRINDLLPEVIVSEQNPRESVSDCERSHESATAHDRTGLLLEVVDVSNNNCEEIDVFKNHVGIEVLKDREEIDALKERAETVNNNNNQTIAAVTEAIVSDQNPRGSVSDIERSHESATAHDSTGLLLEVVDVSNNIEEIDVFENHVGIEVSKDHEEIDALKEHAETVNNNQTIAAVTEAIVSDQNPNTDGEQSDERLGEIIVYKKSEEIDSLMMNLEEPDTSKTREINDVPKNHVEVDSLKKAEETVPDTLCDDKTITAVAEAVVLEPKFNGMADNCELSHENVRTPESLEEIDVQSNILKKPEQTDSLKKKNKRTGSRSYDKESVALNKFGRKLQFFCKKMNFKGMKWHIVKHISKTFDLRVEIAKALKLAKDPAKLVLNSIGIVQGNGAFCQDKQSPERKAAVLILECFVMISSDDGIEIAKVDQEYAVQAAVDWRERMIREGGFGHTDEVDARGLLLLISGFGIQDDVFNIQDIVDLVRASNVKGISTALRCSVFLMPKIPEVINLMVKNNLEIEAVDMAYAFGLEDICNPRNILTTYLLNIIEDIQNNSPFQMVDVANQQLFDLKSIKQCLESHNVDPSVLLPDIKINEKIQNLENEVNKWKIIQKRKSLENPFQQETKRACFGHESMTSQQKPVDHYGMNRFNQSTQPGTSYFDSDRNSSNSYITNHSASSVYNASAMPENMPDLVPNGLSGGFPGSYDQAMRTAKEFDVSTNPEEINALKKHAETDSSKKPEETVLETSCDQPISATPEAIVLEQNPNGMATNGEQSHENVTTPESLEESNVSNKPEEVDNLMKPEQTDICKNPEETVVLKKPEEPDTPMIAEKIVEAKKPEEIAPETCCDQITPAVPEVIISEQSPNGMAANCNQSHGHMRTPENHEEIDASKNLEIIDVSKKLEQTDILNKPEDIDIFKKPKQTDICKNPKEAVVLKKPEELVTLVIPEELNTSKKPEETVPQMSCDQTTRAVSKQNPNRMATKCDQSHENVSQKHAVTDVSKKPEQPDILKPEQTDIYKNPEEIDTLKKHEETSISKKDKESEALKKVVVSVLQFLCQSMRHKEMKWHVAEHLSELSNLRVEVANALRLAEDPAQLVLNSIGRFFKQKCRQFCKDLSPHHDKQNAGRHAAVLILECFVMISGDGIKIAKSDQERAAQAAVDWRKRIISEGGLEHTDEVDARGLLLLISGFGIENHVFRTQDIMALIRASNVKGISTALRRSVFLIPKIPMVIFLMVKHNLEIEAVDVAYTFGLEDMCHPRNILTTYLHKKVIDFQNSSVSGMLEAMKQYLSDLKSVKQCLESHNVDPSTLLPDFKINEKIQNLEKEVNEWKLTQKREPLENPLYQEAKRACNGHENMHCQQKLIDRYGMNQFNSSTQLSTGCNDSDQNFGNTYVTNHSVSSVYDASAMPENIPCLVPNGQAGGFPGSYDQTMYEETVRETSCDQTLNVVPEAIVSEQNPNKMATNCDQRHENVKAPESLEEIDVSKKHAVINTSKKPEQTDICKNPEETVVLKKPGVIDTSMVPEETYTSKYLEEIDTSEKPGETLPETSCDQTTPVVPEAIVSEQNPNGMATNHEQSHEYSSKKPAVISIPKKPEQTDICKNPEETVVLKKLEELDASMNQEEIHTSNKPELVAINPDETAVLKKPEEIDTSKKHEESGIPNGTATNREQSHENASKNPAVIGISKKLEQTDICENPEETVVLKKPEELDTSMNQEEIDTSKKPELVDICKNPEETGVLKKPEEIDTSKKHEESGIEASKKSVVSVLESLCQTMSSKDMKWYVAKHFSEMINLREEIAKALKLAKDPAQLVLNSIGRFFVQGTRTFCKGSGSYQADQERGRMAAVLILECFVMISGDGIKIAKSDQERAAQAAVDWRKRIIREGGLEHTDEVDARGLLLLISGFGIQEHVFKVQDIMDLIRSSNVKGISTALRRSACLIPKIPWVIFLMVKNNLEIEAVDIAYTFGLEDMCHPQDILTKYLNNKIKDFQSGSCFQMQEALEQHLLDLKSVKQCLESHNVDPSTLLPDFKINEKIQNLEKEVNKWKLIQKRKSLENPIHQQTKRACFGHENMSHQQKPIDYYGMNVVNRSTQLGTNHFDPGNSYVANNSASPVYNASAVPENIPSPVPNGQAGGFPGSSDQMMHMAGVQPYGWNGPYDQHYSRHGQVYDSHPYGPWEPGQLESFPGFPGRQGPSSDLYSFADIVEKECMR